MNAPGFRERIMQDGRWATVAAIALTMGLLGSSGCGPPLSRLPREGDLHPRLTRFAYIEEGKLISFLVDTEATRHREDAEFIPIGIGVANLGLRNITLTRESLTLFDDTGKRYSMATVPEVRELGGLAIYDLTLSKSFAGVFNSRFASWPKVDSVFYPIAISEAGVRGRRVVRDRVHLSRYSWMVDVIYFPHPEGKLMNRRYELWLDAEELEEPAFVKFRVQ